ncbi:MAG: response regulator [Elusimicrobia bacterium]|nr:response regulator [Elusimicrobiota bacterium]
MYRIGLVEDDVLMQKMWSSVLKADGLECVLCPNGASALERLPKERPDLVLLDVNLPDIDGHEICRRLKGDERTRAIPIIMLTGEARELEQRVRGLELGADDYLFKPISPKVLLARVRAILLSSGRTRP